jgi:hypothetical protein
MKCRPAFEFVPGGQRGSNEYFSTVAANRIIGDRDRGKVAIRR